MLFNPNNVPMRLLPRSIRGRLLRVTHRHASPSTSVHSAKSFKRISNFQSRRPQCESQNFSCAAPSRVIRCVPRACKFVRAIGTNLRHKAWTLFHMAAPLFLPPTAFFLLEDVTSLISLLPRASKLPRRGAAWQHCCSCKLGPVPRLAPLLSKRTAAPHHGC